MQKRTLAAGVVLGTLLVGCVVTPPYQPTSGVPPQRGYQAYADQYGEPPPPLPAYEQPPVPEEGYLWMPGFWRASPAGYFWVPGTWVLPPQQGLLWTPGYWASAGTVYVFHPGYWGPHVGYYGGINYGHGYFGNGYAGGRWVNNRFHYNTAVTNVNQAYIHNTYNQTIVNNNVTNITNVTRVSYVGGPNTRAQPTAEEAAATRERHLPPTAAQVQHESAARAQPDLNARSNQGHPPVAATPHPAQFGAGGTPVQPGGPADRPPGSRPVEHEAPTLPAHARDLPGPAPVAPPAAANPSDRPPHAGTQPDLQARHEHERQALAQQQQQEDADFERQPGQNPQAHDAMEKRHQQQTQQLQQRHQQENERGPKIDSSNAEPAPQH